MPNKSFGKLVNISPKTFIFLKISESKFSYIEVLFTDQNCKLLDIEDKRSITLVVTKSITHKK